MNICDSQGNVDKPLLPYILDHCTKKQTHEHVKIKNKKSRRFRPHPLRLLGWSDVCVCRRFQNLLLQNRKMKS